MFEDGISEMLASIESRGYYECKQVVSSKTAERLRAYMDTQYEQDQFKKAGVGKGASLVINESIRKDSILWIEREPKNELVADYASFVSELIPQLNRHFSCRSKTRS